MLGDPKKRTWMMVVWLLVLSLVFAGCSSGGSTADRQDEGEGNQNENESASKPVTIEAWFTPVLPEATLEQLAEEFNAQSDDVKVDMTVLTWNNGREKIKTSLATGQGPDVFYIGNGLDQSYIDSGILAPLREVGVSQAHIDKFDPMINMNAEDGKIYALPLNFDVYVLYYRKDILQQYGFQEPPKTWDEMKAMAKTISEESNGEVMGFQLKGADDHLNAINLSWQSMLAAAGGNFIQDGKSAMHSPEGIEALSYLKSYYDEGVSQLGPSAANGFAEGNVAMFYFVQNVGDVSGWADIEGLEGNWAMAPMPKGPHSSAAYAGGHAAAVNAKSEHAEAAAKFLEWFASPKNSVYFMDNGHGIPPYQLDKIDPAVKTAIEEKVEADKENWEAIFEQLANSSPELSIQNRIGFSARWDAQKTELIAALAGEKSVEEALKNLDARINQAIGQ